MAIGALVPLSVLIVILAAVGFRLLRLWRRTRELPELCLGLGLLVLSGSMPLSAAGRAPGLAMEMTGRACFSLGMLAIWIAISFVIFFTYWVFRRGTGWARALASGLSVVLACAAVYISIQNFSGDSVAAIKPRMRPGTLTLMGATLVGFLWGGLESFRHWASLRRRLALGLVDAVLVDRFWLWGVASTTTSALILVIAACVLAGMTILREPAPLAALAAAGCAMCATWYLTFFAPEPYQRWIRARAGQKP